MRTPPDGLGRGRTVQALSLFLASVLALPGSAGGQTAAYLDHDALTRELRALTEGSEAARLSSLGRSRDGREIWLVEIGAPGGAPLAERPAVLVVGQLSGSHMVGSSLALEMARHLTSAGDSATRATLAERTVYVVPRLDPDAAEARFGPVLWDRARSARPTDDDNDGRVDEDGPDDLNGDGLITVMRVPDPEGAYMVDPDEPRLMKKADPAQGETGTHVLYWEGTDADGDGFIAEDGLGGVDLDRNFQHAYPYYEADAGPHMVSEPETRALMDFTIAHRNIAAILAFGPSDNLVTPPDSRGELADPALLDLVAFADASNADVYEVGVFDDRPGGFGFGFFFGGGGSQFRGAQPGRDNDPSSGRRPVTTVNDDDLRYFEAVSEAYREITGIEKVGLRREPRGAFFQYGYFQFGVPSFVTPGWGLATADSAEEAEAPEEAADAGPPAGAARGGRGGPGGARGMRPGGGGRRPGGGPPGGGGRGADAEILRALESAGIDAFVPWSPFEHPTLGEVEIGGFRPYATANPPAERLPELGRAHGEFLVRLAGMLPRVRIVEAEATAHGGGIFTVSAEVGNTGYFPSATAHGVVAEAVHPVIVQIQVPPEDVLTGAHKTSRIEKLDGSGRRERLTWVVRGSSGDRIEIRALSQKGGTHAATVTLP